MAYLFAVTYLSTRATSFIETSTL